MTTGSWRKKGKEPKSSGRKFPIQNSAQLALGPQKTKTRPFSLLLVPAVPMQASGLGADPGRSAFGSGPGYDEEDDDYRRKGVKKEEGYSANSLAKKLGVKSAESKKDNDEDDFGEFASAEEEKEQRNGNGLDLLGENEEAAKPKVTKGFSLPKPPKATGSGVTGNTDLCKQPFNEPQNH